MFLVELLAEVLGEEPTEMSLWRASNRGRDGVDVAVALTERYRAAILDPLPAKTPATFRPAFLVDYVGRANTPYDREFAFIARTLSYADQVAVVDEVARWAALPDVEADLQARSFEGFADCNNVTWSLRRIARYGILERAQLLYYIDSPAQGTSTIDARTLAEDAAPDLRALVEQRHGWRAASELQSEFRTSLAADELVMWFNQLALVLEQLQAHHQHIDLYLPDWFAGPDLLEWLYRQSNPPAWFTADTARDHRALSTLVNLPAPTSDMIHRLSSTDLLAVRERDHMAAWRAAIRSDIGRLAHSPDLATRLDVDESLRHHAQQLAHQERSRAGLTDGLQSVIAAGVAVAPAALATGQDWVGAAAVSASPVALTLMANFCRWLIGSDPERGDVRDRPEESRAIRTFLSEPTNTSPDQRRPPTSWMRTLDGQPMAFDLFDLFSEGGDR